MINVEHLSKVYRVHKRPPGLAAALRSVFRRKFEPVQALDDLSFAIASGERVGFDAGRWPIDAFQSRLLRWIFTHVFPLALMTTFPAQALLGTLDGKNTAVALAGGVGFAVVARLVWTRALRFYTSASS